MQTAPFLLSFLLILLYYSGWTHGLCQLINSTVMSCSKFEDVKYIETYNLETLKAPVTEDVLVPGLFDKFNDLRHLDLSGGNLKKIEPGCFRTLTNLRSLNLGDNRIEYLELSSLEGLHHLRSLSLRKNAIRQLPPALARLKNLRHLDIHGNPFDCNCATLKVRDLITQRGVTISKKIVCAGPSNMKGTSLMKSSTTIICTLEQQDREMQNDQAEGSGTDLGSGELDGFNEEEDEYMEVHNGSSEKPKEVEVETPFSTVLIDPTTETSLIKTISKESAVEDTSTKVNSLGQDEEIFFDNEDKKEQLSTTEMSRKKEDFKDALFYPSWGSGDGEESSGEGSGASWTHYDEEKTRMDSTSEEPSFFSGGGLWDLLFGGFTGTTAAPSETKDIDLEEEQFINASPNKINTEEPVVSSKSPLEESDMTTTVVSITNVVEVMKSVGADDESKSGNVKAEADELEKVSLIKQSKKGMGSYVVLASLLAVLAILIGFAAYKGDFCKKKRRKRNTENVENGTEMKDMQRSLLPDAGNSTQPKITSNGNTENVPLVDGIPDTEKVDKVHIDSYQTEETAKSLNGTADHPDHPEPVKPARKLINPQNEHKIEERPRIDVNSLREKFLAGRTSPTEPSISSTTTNNGPTMPIPEPNGPPVSPGAQRVKITLQENPDSVPKTPILITRTMAGENLVKTP